jgi:hypothetical protein
VPEAAINEDRETGAPEDKIGMAWERLVAAPAGDVRGAENGGELQLGSFVAFRAHAGFKVRS